MTPGIRVRIRREERFATTLLLVGTILLAWPVGAFAANIHVDTTVDELDGDADCSLREAIQAANTDAAVSGCSAGSGADSIAVPAGLYRLTRVGASENGNATGDLDVQSDVTISGSGAVIDGNGTDRELHVLAGTVIVEGALFQNGRAPSGADGADCVNQTDCDRSAGNGEEGGGILTQAGSDLTLRRVVVADNQAGTGGAGGDITCPAPTAECFTFGGAGGNGGGVSGNGALTIEQSLLIRNRSGSAGSAGAVISCGDDCFSGSGNGGDGGGVIITGGSMALLATTVDDNESVDWAGGVYCHHNSTCTIRDTTIVGNHASFRGGGLTVTGVASSATVANTTVSGNTAMGPGGGVSAFSGALDLDFVTVAGNSAGSSGGGGVDRALGAVTMRNSIVADNTGGTGPNCSGIITTGGYNHVESLTGCTMVPGTGDVTGSDPSLMGLGDNGGPTATRALPPSSLAVDAIPNGTNGCGTTALADQRSALRPMDGDDSSTAACDKGAFELEGATDCPASVPVCETAAKSNLVVADASPDAGKDKLLWKFKGGTTDLTQAGLGDPTSGTVWALCLYQDSTLKAAIRLTDSSRWSAVKTTGYKYADKTAAVAGISKAVLKAGAAGKSTAVFAGKGDNLPDPLPLGPIPPNVTVVARNSSTATCFSAAYSTAKKNQPNLLKAP